MTTNTIPVQTRSIDPYSSYHSDVVSALTDMISNETNCLFSTHAIDVTQDTTSVNTIIVSTGQAFKDKILVRINEEFSVDMEDPAFYLGPTAMTEVGYYYVVLKYTYARARPAPSARIRILKSTERSLYNATTSAYLFLKCVKVIFNGVRFVVDELYDYDPSIPANRRLYSPLFAGVEDTLPTFDPNLHEAKIIYVRSLDSLYFGDSARWVEFNAVRERITTVDCEVGDLAYINASGTTTKAIATTKQTLADCVILQKGLRADGSGFAKLYGICESVPVETGRRILPGENCYLSGSEPGKVTDVQNALIVQHVGTCIEEGEDSTSVITIWFQPGSSGGSGSGQSSEYDNYQDLLSSSVFNFLTADLFTHEDFIDQSATTATYDSINEEISATSGQVFQSTNLTDLTSNGCDSTCITTCQLSSEGTVQSVQSWYVTNNGGDVTPDWEPVTLNQVHWFSTAYLPITDSTSTFEIDEIITGTTSGTTAVITGVFSDHLLIKDVTGPASSFTNTEEITGATSGATATAGIQTSRTSDNNDLRVKCVFSGISTIEDYGFLYDLNATLIETTPENAWNLDTLYADIYTTPSQDNDGIADLTVPLETCKDSLQTYVGSPGDLDITPDYGTPQIVTQSTDLTNGITELDTESYIQKLDDIYMALISQSFFERCSIEGFDSTAQIDLTITTADQMLSPYRIVGTNGEILASTNLYDSLAGLTYINQCQLSADVLSTGNYTWYVCNDGGTDWEVTTLNTVHNFAEISLPITDSTGSFTIGEVITGGTSGTFGTYNGMSADGLSALISELGGSGVFDSTSAEIITGVTSGSTAMVNGSQVSRTTTSFRDLRMMCLFGALGGTIYNYGILYDLDGSIIANSTSVINEYNIEQLAVDLYTSPNLDNDGIANLITPIETCKDNLQTFVGSSGDTDVAPTYSSVNSIVQNSDLETAIGVLDDRIGFSTLSRTVTSLDATPSVLSGGKQCGILNINNAGATTITDLDDAIDDMLIVLLFNDNNTILQYNANLNLAGEADFKPSINDSLMLVYDSNNSIWTEISRQGSGSAGIDILEDSATPSVLGYDKWVTDATCATNITFFNDGTEGQEITIIFMGDDIDIIYSANMVLQGGVSFLATRNDTIKLIYYNGIWREISRSVNG